MTKSDFYNIREINKYKKYLIWFDWVFHRHDNAILNPGH